MSERRQSLSSRYRAPPLRELQIHLAVAELLRKTCSPDWDYTHFPAGEKRDTSTAAKLQAMGLKPGWPDFIFVGPLGVLRFLELKRHDGELDGGRRASLLNPEETPQQSFFRRMEARGVECRVARSIEEAIRILSAWGVVRIAKKGEAA